MITPLFISNFKPTRMKRFIIKIFLLLILSTALATFIMLLVKNEVSKNSHEVNVAFAYEKLEELKDTNKIVIISGSNGAFSINSQIISDTISMPVVNTSTHAGIGVRMQFEIYKDLLKKGDIIVFCPEYYSDKSRLYGEGALFRILSTHIPSAYFKMSAKQWWYTFKHIALHFTESLKVADCKPFEGPYSARSINEFGDISCKREPQDFNTTYVFKGNMDKETLSYYQYIHDYSKKHGFYLVYLPPCLNESNFLHQKSQIDSLDVFMEQNNIPFQSTPSRYVFPDSLFFDTPYHMTTKGAELRTLVLTEDLKQLIETCHF